MDGIPTLQELLLTLELENRAAIEHRTSLLRSSQRRLESQQPVTNVNDILSQSHGKPSAAAASKVSLSPQGIVSKGETTPKFQASLATGIAATQEQLLASGRAAGSASGTPHSTAASVTEGDAIQGTHDPVLSRIIDGLVLKREIMRLKKLATPRAHSSPELQVPQISCAPAHISSVLPHTGQNVMHKGAAIPNMASTKDPVLSRLIDRLAMEQQKGTALLLTLKTLQGHSTPGHQVSQDSSLSGLSIPAFTHEGEVNTTREAIHDSLLTQTANRSSDDQKRQISLLTTTPSLVDLQSNRSMNYQGLVTSVLAPVSRTSVNSSARPIILPLPTDNMVGRLPFRAPRQGQENVGRVIGGIDHGALTNLFCNTQNPQALDSSVTRTASFEGDPIIPVALDSENCTNMPEYQCLFRQQLVYVETNHARNDGRAQGRSIPISKGQVGILCRHCALLPPMSRAPGAVYYPAKLDRIYQAAVNMGTNHFESRCSAIPEQVRQHLKTFKERKITACVSRAGKAYWADAARQVGVREGQDGLFLDKQVHKNNKKRGIKEPRQTGLARKRRRGMVHRP